MKYYIYTIPSILIALLSFGIAIAHMSCLYLGPACFEAQMAPQEIIDSAQQGTWEAPIITTVISILFIMAALYTLSSIKVIRQLPLLNLAIYTLSSICVVRGISPSILNQISAEMVQGTTIYVDMVWFVSGLIIFAGHKYNGIKKV